MLIKKIVWFRCLLATISVGLCATLLVGCGQNQHTAPSSLGFIKDSASGDTSTETLKTLTADISSVEQQNKQIVDQNNVLTTQDKTTLEQFKKDIAIEVQQQIASAKASLQTAQPNQASTPNTTATGKTASEDSTNTATTDQASGFVWIEDLQTTSDSSNSTASAASSKQLAGLLNPGSADKESSSNNTNNGNNNLILPTLGNDNTKKPLAIPYYTIPVNATLTGAIAMQPIIGRIPIDGKVPDPYTFKAIIGSKDLAANGVDIPPDIQGIVVSGIAEGDMLGHCSRGEVTAMTFVFQDGRISTTQAQSGSSLGTIAGANGNPCLAGTFHTDAAIFLGATAALAGMQGYGNALSQAQLNNTTSSSGGSTISSLVGNANTYAFGQGFSASAQAAQTWWNQRVQNSFDFVYVPNVDPKTGKKLQLNINITQEIPIDYDPNGRKVFYDHQQNTTTTPQLD